MAINPENFDEELEPKIKDEMGNKPPRATKQEIDAEYEEPFTVPSTLGSGRGFMGKLTQGGIGMQVLATVIIVGLAVVFLMPSMYVSKSDFEANLANVVASIDTVSSGLMTMKADLSNGMEKLNGALNDVKNIPSTIEHKFNQVMPNEMAQYEERIQQIENDLNATKVQEDLAALSESLANAKATISAVGEKLNTFIDTFTDNISTIEGQIEELSDKGSSSSSSSGTSTDVSLNDIEVYAYATDGEANSEGDTKHLITIHVYNDSGYVIDNMKIIVSAQLKDAKSGIPMIYPYMRQPPGRWSVLPMVYGGSVDNEYITIRGSHVTIEEDEEIIQFYLVSEPDEGIDMTTLDVLYTDVELVY